MELSTFATYVGLVRDFLLITVSLVVLVASLAVLMISLALYKKVSGAARSVKQTAKSIEETAAAVSSKATGPAGAGAALVISKLGSLLWRLARKRQREKEDDA